jgi:hypothetical protein
MGSTSRPSSEPCGECAKNNGKPSDNFRFTGLGLLLAATDILRRSFIRDRWSLKLGGAAGILLGAKLIFIRIL